MMLSKDSQTENMENKKYIVGFDIGGTKCAVTLARPNGDEKPQIIKKIKFPTEKNAPKKVLELFMKSFELVLSEEKLKYSDISGIGISCGGPLNSKTGVVMSPPNLPGWDNIRVCEYFETRTCIPCRLQNDANACALAEWKYGAGKGCTNVAFLTFGTGLGAGLILDGKLYSGSSDNAGEIGHVRLAADGPIGYGKRGSCEGFCSGGGIAQLGTAEMRRLGENCSLYKACGGDESKLDAKLIAELADANDPIAIGIYDLCAEKLGLTLSILCDIVDPERIILGGIYMRSAHLIEKKMKEVMAREALNPCPVVPAGLGENVGDYAAIALAPTE